MTARCVQDPPDLAVGNDINRHANLRDDVRDNAPGSKIGIAQLERPPSEWGSTQNEFRCMEDAGEKLPAYIQYVQ